MTKEATEGLRYDTGKLRWDLLPPEIEEVVKVFTMGAVKYSDRNWELGMNYGRVIAAMFRHIFAWLKGETNDPESGLHHLAHAQWNILALLVYEKRGMTQFDDRGITIVKKT